MIFNILAKSPSREDRDLPGLATATPDFRLRLLGTTAPYPKSELGLPSLPGYQLTIVAGKKKPT
jgi:hypothetical protein